jgi:hypothetical protein
VYNFIKARGGGLPLARPFEISPTAEIRVLKVDFPRKRIYVTTLHRLVVVVVVCIGFGSWEFN